MHWDEPAALKLLPGHAVQVVLPADALNVLGPHSAPRQTTRARATRARQDRIDARESPVEPTLRAAALWPAAPDFFFLARPSTYGCIGRLRTHTQPGTRRSLFKQTSCAAA